MDQSDRFKLMFGPYKAPPFRRGDITLCLLRDCTVKISGWSDARIPWPQCYCFDRSDRRPRGDGWLVDAELLRAIRHESVMAVMYWWGVSYATVVRWRRVFGVKLMENEGSRRLKYFVIQHAMDSRPRGGRLWTEEETALVGVLPDAEVGRLTGRKTATVHKKRQHLGRPAVHAKSARPKAKGKGSKG